MPLFYPTYSPNLAPIGFKTRESVALNPITIEGSRMSYGEAIA